MKISLQPIADTAPKLRWKACILALIAAVTVIGGANGAQWVEGELVVVYRDRPAFRYAAQKAAGADLQRRQLTAASQLGNRHIEVVRSTTLTTRELMDEYQGRPDVESVTPNYLRYVRRSLIPDVSRFQQQWGLLNTGQTVNGFTGTAGADIGATRAWPMSRPAQTPEMVIAVIDTGVDYRHPDLAGIMWVNPGEQPGTGSDDDGNNYIDDVFGYDFSGADIPLNQYWKAKGPDPMDIDGHGTHMAGIAAAAANNAAGIAGVANARIMALKASPDGNAIPLHDSIEAMSYAIMMKRDYGVPVVVINASYGGPGGSNRLERETILAAGEAGIVVCAAAGNNGANNDQRPFYPASYQAPNLISVTASNARDELAAISNYGKQSVHLAAPGMNIVSSIPLWNRTKASLEKLGSIQYDASGLEFSGFADSLTAMVMDCGIGKPHQFPGRIEGKIALIERGGGLYFHEKVRNAIDAGAIAAVIYNHQTGDFMGTLVGPEDWIPALTVSRQDGLNIRAAIETAPTLLTLSHEPVKDEAYAAWNGTSMATAFVSGAIAFVATLFPEDNPEQRIARLLDTVEVLPAFEQRVKTAGRLDLRRATDSDDDGLPDWWEIKWAGDLHTMNAETDTAANGFPDWQEYRAGTNPNDPNDTLKITGLIFANDNTRRLTWSSVEGKSYDVARAYNPTGNFTALATGLDATPPYNVWIDSNAPAAGPLFYKIKLND